MVIAQKSSSAETKPRRLRHALTSVAVGLMVAARSDAAEPTLDQPASAEIAAAQALFERGRELMAEQRAEEACPLFEESQRLQAGIGTLFNLASCYEAVGRFASAHILFLDVAAAARARGQEERAQVASSRARSVELQISRMVIEVASEQQAVLTVEHDGSVVRPVQWGLAVPVDPGLHQIRAYGPGFVPWSRTVDVGRSPGVYTVQIRALPLDSGDTVPCDPGSGACTSVDDARDARPFWEPLPHRFGLAALSVGVLSLSASAGLALHAVSTNERSERAGCVGGSCPNEAGLELRRKAISTGNWATAAAGVGLAGIAAACILFWVVPEPGADGEPTAWVAPRLADETTGIELYGRF